MGKHRTIGEKENALRALKRTGDPEWVPVGSDCCAILVPSALRERPPMGESGKDWFGCSWVFDPSCFGFAPDLHSPYLLEDITEWRDIVKFPDLDAVDWEAAAKKDYAEIDRDERVVRLFVEAGPLERTHHLMGFDNAFVAMCEEPEEYKALIDAIADYKIKLIDTILPIYKPDEIFFHDDLGTARGAMISLEMYRELLKPAHLRIGQAIGKYDVIHTHHSCGGNEVFLEDLYETGARLFNSIQPMNDRPAIAKRFAGRASFDVGVDSVSSQLSTEDEIRKEVRDIIDVFGPYKSVMVSAAPTNANTLDKIEIAVDETRIYGGSFYD